ncbi:unnamed protein product [Vicia faba]|uniref:non-specific serine/threonine protein kinase n=1 Tax=Vicia faba TaxID=3906 RepID=A0AAV0ZCJ3_VICFA|nr:unnamed protein product [Vicia faba]
MDDFGQKYFYLVNGCKYRVWPASSSTAGNTHLEIGNFSLNTGDEFKVWAPSTWSGHIWGRTRCINNLSTGGNFSCITGDCGTGKQSCDGMRGLPLATLAEFRLSNNSGAHFYNISVIEGFNIPIEVTTMGASCGYQNRNGTNTFTCSFNVYKIMFCPAFSTGTFDQSVSVGESLTAGNGTDRWVSLSGEFAFGFYQLPNDLFLLAIWYEKINSTDSIIWYAKGDNPIPNGSRLVLNDSHGLMLSNPQGLELWRSSYFTSSRVSIGLMKDDGNFQLLDQNKVILWKSFSDSTDTLVPGQELNSNSYLYSRKGEFNFSRGMFELSLQKNGHGLLLNHVNFPTKTYYSTHSGVYNESGVVDPNNGDKLIFDNSLFYLYILKRNGGKISITDPKDYVSNNAYYYKATITYDGVFTLSYHPKYQNNSQGWVIEKTIPENICLDSTFNKGPGVCGLNSICTLINQRPVCTCPEGYSLMDSNNIYGGCIQNSHVTCQGRNQGSQNDTHVMMKIPETYWPYSDYETKRHSSLQDCTDSCLKDCLCALVFFNESSCLKKKLPLSHGRKDISIQGISIMKMRKNDTLHSPPNLMKGNGTLINVMSIIFGFSIAIVITLVGAIFYWYNSKKIKSSTINKRVVDRSLRIFSFKEITQVTNNFREELGRGSCSIVYKGMVDVDTYVAVKKLDKLFQDSDKEFQTEMNVIIKTHHRNLVRLHGYCSEDQHRILVYELMSNGTLATFLFTPLKPNWNQRVQIAIGIARGLVYLHEECSTQIIHCDIKPQNILLDDDYNARISDFGLAKLLLINQSHTKTGIRGTKGYVAPDWFRSAPITSKVDAFSFGVLLLEIICCRKNVEDDTVSEEKRILIDWAYDCYKTGKIDVLLENEHGTVNDMSIFEKFIMISIWCTQEDPSLRPPMKKVLLMLEGIVEVEIPPNPYLYDSSNQS